jgi:hypothetical protein
MTGWELGLQTAGIVFQVVGLVAVAVGIWAAWSENAAPDDNLLTRIVDRPLRFVWVNVLRRRPRRQPAGLVQATDQALSCHPLASAGSARSG